MRYLEARRLSFQDTHLTFTEMLKLRPPSKLSPTKLLLPPLVPVKDPFQISHHSRAPELFPKVLFLAKLNTTSRKDIPYANPWKASSNQRKEPTPLPNLAMEDQADELRLPVEPPTKNPNLPRKLEPRKVEPFMPS